jgi:uncharacterized protein (DUF1810 family)
MTASDPYDLSRFVAAQDAGGSYARASEELRRGQKTSHWMWFVFPQLAGLGMSSTSQHFAIAGLAEARAYLDHPLLGPRLLECAAILTRTSGHTAEQIFGGIDAMKLRSSMTLFRHARPEEPAFDAVLRQYFAGEPDPLTDRLVAVADDAGASRAEGGAG